jgi:energy-coupling factor transporter ATP-binding protein EcfA2
MELLVDTAKKQGAAVLVVTHEPRVAGFADRTVLMRDGVDSVQVNGVPAELPLVGDSLRVSTGAAEPSADTISWGRSGGREAE